MVTSATTSTIIPTDDISPGTGVSDYACLVDHSGDAIDHYYSFIYHSYGRKRSPYTVFAGACLVTHSGDGFYINVNFSYGRTIAELDQFRLRVYSPPFWLRPLRLLLGRPFLRRLVWLVVKIAGHGLGQRYRQDRLAGLSRWLHQHRQLCHIFLRDAQSPDTDYSIYTWLVSSSGIVGYDHADHVDYSYGKYSICLYIIRIDKYNLVFI